MSVFAVNSDEPIGGRYFVKAVEVTAYLKARSMSFYYTKDGVIRNAGQVSNSDFLAEHSSCCCWHCTFEVKFIIAVNALPLLEQ